MEIFSTYIRTTDKGLNIEMGKMMLEELGHTNVDFIGYSDSNGVSVYFSCDRFSKIRISDHGISNINRLRTEKCYSFDSKTIGIGGKIGYTTNMKNNILFSKMN